MKFKLRLSAVTLETGLSWILLSWLKNCGNFTDLNTVQIPRDFQLSILGLILFLFYEEKVHPKTENRVTTSFLRRRDHHQTTTTFITGDDDDGSDDDSDERRTTTTTTRVSGWNVKVFLPKQNDDDGKQQHTT